MNTKGILQSKVSWSAIGLILIPVLQFLQTQDLGTITGWGWVIVGLSALAIILRAVKNNVDQLGLSNPQSWISIATIGITIVEFVQKSITAQTGLTQIILGILLLIMSFEPNKPIEGMVKTGGLTSKVA